jgi:hypothetical protein
MPKRDQAPHSSGCDPGRVLVLTPSLLQKNNRTPARDPRRAVREPGRIYETDWRCPAHGLAEALTEVSAGRADIVRNEPEHTAVRSHRRRATSRPMRR